MRVRAILLAAALTLAPLGVRAADLVVWWEEGFYPGEDDAVREMMAAFEKITGKRVELVQYSQDDMPVRALTALEVGHPPDFLFGTTTDAYYSHWAHEGWLADIADALGPFTAQFDKDALERATLLDATTGRHGLYALPMARFTNHVHVWTSLLERAGFTLADVPKQWEPFWAFWCERVQPAVRRATGRDDLYGVGLAMSVEATDTGDQFRQFMDAYETDYVTRDGRLVIDEPEVRARLAKALDSYTAIWRKGCTPPASVDWDNRGNSRAFLERGVVMTPNPSLSILSALRATRPEDYYKDAATIEWPAGAHGQPLAIYTGSSEAAVFRDGGHTATAEEFVRFLVGEGWLAHWLDFAGDRNLPPMPALLAAPFWLDAGDPHRMAAAMQYLTRPHDYWDMYAAISGDWRHDRVYVEHVWATAIHRIIVDGLSPERAVDEAIVRIHQILSE
jgi:multiple sugar transport system substrate-binding protein